MDLARRRGIEVVERAIWPDELESFQQMFITGSPPVTSSSRSDHEPSRISRQMARTMTPGQPPPQRLIEGRTTHSLFLSNVPLARLAGSLRMSG
jgi:hypothetical protein